MGAEKFNFIGVGITMTKTYVYVAGPYMDSGKTHDFRGYHEIDQNISRARGVAVWLAHNGIPYFCPHLNSCHFEVIVPDAKPEFWYNMDIVLLRGASAILLVDGWWKSTGTLKEIEVAQDMGIPIYMPFMGEELLEWWRS